MKKGFICGMFDLFHYGHLLAFEECKEHCDKLTVAVNSGENIDYTINPGKNAPVFPLLHRVELLKACKLIDEVLIYSSEEELLDLLKTGSYQVRFLGDDYKGKPITGAEHTPEIYFTNRNHGYSTSEIRKKIVAQHG